MDDLIELIKNAKWKSSTYMGGHDYVMYLWNPDLHDTIIPVIEEHGYDKYFGRRKYRYWNYGGHRYWVVPDTDGGNSHAVNRAKEDAPRL